MTRTDYIGRGRQMELTSAFCRLRRWQVAAQRRLPMSRRLLQRWLRRHAAAPAHSLLLRARPVNGFRPSVNKRLFIAYCLTKATR